MAYELPFEVAGEQLPTECVAGINAFIERMAHHRWGGGCFLDQMVLVSAGGVANELRRTMPRDAYLRWSRFQRGRSVPPASHSFLAADERRISVVSLDPDRNVLLERCARELLVGVLLKRQDDEGYDEPRGTDEAAGHVLWTEYVLERARYELGNDLHWSTSVPDAGHLAAQADQIEETLSGRVSGDGRRRPRTKEPPPQALQSWLNLARDWSTTSGRADAGCQQDIEARRRFHETPMIGQAASDWICGEDFLSRIWEHCDFPLADLDEHSTTSVANPLFTRFRMLWARSLEEPLP